MKKVRDILHITRAVIVWLYEFSLPVAIYVFVYLVDKDIFTGLPAIFGMFFYFFPHFCLFGVFGDKPKKFAYKVMGYQ